MSECHTFVTFDGAVLPVSIFEHDKSGALFVFGGVSGDISSFAFGVLPIIIFFSMTISILYYIGFMTYIITKVGLKFSKWAVKS